MASTSSTRGSLPGRSGLGDSMMKFSGDGNAVRDPEAQTTTEKWYWRLAVTDRRWRRSCGCESEFERRVHSLRRTQNCSRGIRTHHVALSGRARPNFTPRNSKVMTPITSQAGACRGQLALLRETRVRRASHRLSISGGRPILSASRGPSPRRRRSATCRRGEPWPPPAPPRGAARTRGSGGRLPCFRSH